MSIGFFLKRAQVGRALLNPPILTTPLCYLFAVAKPQITSNILDDPYFSEQGLAGRVEKKEYSNAKGRLSTNQKAKMARVMQQWQEAQEHYETLKAKDPEVRFDRCLVKAPLH